MAAGMPSYNNEEHQSLSAKIGVFNQILLSMAGVNAAINDDGRKYIREFMESHTYTDEYDEDAIDVKPLADLLYMAAKEHAAVCAVRSREIYSYLENAMIVFPEPKWSKSINSEIALYQRDAIALQKDLHATKVIFKDAIKDATKNFFHKQRGNELTDLQAKFIEFLLCRAQGVVDDGNPHIAPLFNFAGRQMRLARATQEYAAASTIVVEAAVRLLLGMTRQPQHYNTAEFTDLRDMARHMVISTNTALGDGMRMACDSYVGLAVKRPMFRTEQPSPH